MLFEELKRYTDGFGQLYGSEDLCFLLYSLVKMRKPEFVLELGTGMATTALWMGMALKENKHGKITTIDNGSHWPLVIERFGSQLPKRYQLENYDDYVKRVVDDYSLSQQIQFENIPIEKYQTENEIDILFSDYSHYIYNIYDIFSKYLVKMKSDSYLIIDSVPGNKHSWIGLKNLIHSLNNGEVPSYITDTTEIHNKIKNSIFSLIPILENKNREQNSTAMIHIGMRTT